MNFQINYDKPVLKFLKKLDKNISKRILDKIKQILKEDIIPHNVKAIVGKHGVFRIRIGDYRALYRINYQNKKIVVFKIDKRSKVY